MPQFRYIFRLGLLAVACGGSRVGAAEPAAKIDFNRTIRPILSNTCFQCHGPDAQARQAELRLDSAVAATAPRKGQAAIVPKNPAASAVVARINAADADKRMPPADSGKSLTAAERELIQRWIAEGAEYQQHWAFTRPTPPARPTVTDPKWPRNELDYFVLAALDRATPLIKPAAEADRETLIRRAALDLTGLPPTLAEIDAFLNDTQDQAYERMVDRYLASPSYGEHMARPWLDLARYADTNGYQYDGEREQWVWRDWVINAFNQNQPFDQFTIEQLAGDLLPNATPHQVLATGFNRNHGITIEGGVIDEEYRTEYVMDRVVTASTVWLGLTLGCARCHDHKFDPISQREFYQFFAFFNQVPERGNSGFDPKRQIISPLQDAHSQRIESEIARLRQRLKQPPPDISTELAQWERQIASQMKTGWIVLDATSMKSAGGATLTKLEDKSILAGGVNPPTETYEIVARSDLAALTAVRLEALTHETLPGGGPGRYPNSNFVLSEFELTAVSIRDPKMEQRVRFKLATADYSQPNYEVAKIIDGETANNNGWAVDGPTRKQSATAVIVATAPFGFEGGTELRFRLRHEASYSGHAIGRPRFSITADEPGQLDAKGTPAEIRAIVLTPTAKRTAEQSQQLRAYYLSLFPTEAQQIEQQIARLEADKSRSFPATMIMQDLPTPRPTHVLKRGQYDQPQEQVAAGVPAVFPPLPAGGPANRLALARWLVDPADPLTARVTVNRFWQQIFGTGIVKTAEDFGLQSAPPSHPELLDYLATEFVRSGWNVKQLLRQIVTSATYRQASHVATADYQRDPENRLLARGPRLRLEAEEIRDNALAISGLLVQQLGGKSVYPYQPPGLWMELNNRPGYSKEYAPGTGDDLYRRSLYTFWKRTVPPPMMQTFDAPEREFCTVRRSRTNTPLQALLLLHGPQFVEAARHLAERTIADGGASADERIAYAFRLATARRPTPAETLVLRRVLSDNLANFQQDSAAAIKLLEVGDSPRNRALDPAELAAWTAVARLILNLDEVVTKG